MKLSNIVVEEIIKKHGLKGKIADYLTKYPETIERMAERNDIILQLPAVIEIIKTEMGLTESEILITIPVTQ